MLKVEKISHIPCNFSFPDSQVDALMVEVQDTKKSVQGRTTIPISSLTDTTVCILPYHPMSDFLKVNQYLFAIHMLFDVIFVTMQNDKVRWWPLYHDDQECIGKIQLNIGSTITNDEANHIKVSFLPTPPIPIITDTQVLIYTLSHVIEWTSCRDSSL